MLPAISTGGGNKTLKELFEDQTEVLFEADIAVSDGILSLRESVEQLKNVVTDLLDIQKEQWELSKQKYFEDKETADEARRLGKSKGIEEVERIRNPRGPTNPTGGGSLIDMIMGAVPSILGGAAGALSAGAVARNVGKGLLKAGFGAAVINGLGTIAVDLLANQIEDPELKKTIEEYGDLAVNAASIAYLAGKLFGPVGLIAVGLGTAIAALDKLVEAEKQRVKDFFNRPPEQIKAEIMADPRRGAGKASTLAAGAAAGERSGDEPTATSEALAANIEAAKAISDPERSMTTFGVAKTIANTLRTEAGKSPVVHKAIKDVYDNLPENKRKRFVDNIKSQLTNMDPKADTSIVDSIVKGKTVAPDLVGPPEYVKPPVEGKTVEPELFGPPELVKPLVATPSGDVSQTPEPFDITELRMREDLKNPRNVLPAPRPRSAMDAARDAKELAGRAEERRATLSGDVSQVKSSDTSLTDMVKQFEGFSATPYKDSAGVLTIGYGQTGNIDPTDTVSEEQASAMLVARLEKERTAVKNYGKSIGRDWNENQINALASFRYNLGGERLKQLTKNGERTDEEIAEMMLKYNKANVKGTLTPLAGLTKRRTREAALFKSEPTTLTPVVDSSGSSQLASMSKDAALKQAAAPTVVIAAPTTISTPQQATAPAAPSISINQVGKEETFRAWQAMSGGLY
jgi:GH24 family phage-related lysozyme (muramidase)